MSTPHNVPNPNEAPLARFRIVRGALAVGTDGVLGTVQQIVVDHDSGQLRALIIRNSETTREFELPASHVRHTSGNEVLLDISSVQLDQHPDLVTPYNPNDYVPLYEGVRIPTSTAGEASMRADRPIITHIEDNAAELVTADPSLTAMPPQETEVIRQPGPTSAPVYYDPVADQQAISAAEGLPPNIGRPATPPPTPPTQPRVVSQPVTPEPVNPSAEHPVIRVSGKGPGEVTIGSEAARTPTTPPPIQTPPAHTAPPPAEPRVERVDPVERVEPTRAAQSAPAPGAPTPGTGTVRPAPSEPPNTAPRNSGTVGNTSPDTTIEEAPRTPRRTDNGPAPGRPPTNPTNTLADAADTQANAQMLASDLLASEAPPTPVDHQLPRRTGTPSGTSTVPGTSTSPVPTAILTRLQDEPEAPTPSVVKLPAQMEPVEVESLRTQPAPTDDHTPVPPATQTTTKVEATSGMPLPGPFLLALPLLGLAGAAMLLLTLRRRDRIEDARKARHALHAELERVRIQTRLRERMTQQARERLARDAARDLGTDMSQP